MCQLDEELHIFELQQGTNFNTLDRMCNAKDQ